MFGGGAEMIVLMLVMGGGGSNQVLDYIETDAYWASKGVAVTVENMTKELKLPEKGVNVGKLVKQLGDKDFEKREAAQKALAGAGPEALPELREAAKSTDPEVATRAAKAIEQLTTSGTEAGVRRLMAIRALGELKDAKALPTLERAKGSEKPFEKEYAQRAIAEIKGEAYKPAEARNEDTAKDVWLLPKGCGAAAHLTMRDGLKAGFRKALDRMPPNVNADEKKRIATEMMGTMLKLAEQTGNFRLDGVTLGMSEDFDPQNDAGNVVLILRGKYDAGAMLVAVKNAAGEEGVILQGEQEAPEGDGPAMRIMNVDRVPVLQMADGAAYLILYKGEAVVVVAGPAPKEGAEFGGLPVKEMVQALKTGKGGLRENGEMAKLVQEAQAGGGRAFAAVKMAGALKELPFLSSFETATVSTKRLGDEGEVKVVAQAKDEETATAALEQFEAGRKELLDKVKEAREAADADEETKAAINTFKVFIDLAEGAKVLRDKTTVTLTARFKIQEPGWFLPFMLQYMGAGDLFNAEVPGEGPDDGDGGDE